ncbi:chloride conductance regulatory protein ICln [Senna tora]|uniref:Chloride conductance regulatory protein ICln n=1 Tax=Senna tora TaxID=362788 RepID=A0A834TQV8_9FABA|nr:chloride conductance regulatory protein ICln [Senna tora]
MVLGLRIITERTGDGVGQPVLDTDNGEQFMRVQPGVDIVLGNRPRESHGTLYISTRQVIWLSDVDKDKGYAVDFLSMSLHAVSRDPEAYPVPCIYALVFIETEADQDESDNSDSEHNDTLDLSKIREMRLIPSDPSQLDTLFETFCECAELNPEPNDEEGEEHDWIFGADQMQDEEAEDYISQNPAHPIGQSNGDHDLARTVLQLRIDEDLYEDAEGMEQDGNRSHN